MNTQKMMIMRTKSLVLVGLTSALWACPIVPPEDVALLGDYDPGIGGDGQQVARIVVSPESESLSTGQTRRFTAEAFNAAGTEIRNVTFSWSSGNSSVASVDDSGLVTGGGTAGSVAISACNNVCGNATVQVTVPPVQSVVVSGQGGLLRFGQTQQLSVTVTFQNQTTTTDESLVEWSTGTGGVVTVTSAGLVTAVGRGTTTVSATIGGVASQALTFNVEPAGITLYCGEQTAVSAGASFNCNVVGVDGSGNQVQGIDASLVTLSSPQQGTIVSSITNGVVQTSQTGDGTVTINASYDTDAIEPLTESITIDVVRIGTITIGGATTDLTAGDTRMLTATVTRPSGGDVPATLTVEWLVGQGLVLAVAGENRTATVSTTGIGTSTVGAHIGSTYAAAITIRTVPVAVAITPSSEVEISAGTSTNLGYAATGTGGAPFTVHGTATVAWATDNAGIATVSNGQVTGQSAGQTTIRATINGVQGSKVVTVVAVSENPSFAGLTGAEKEGADSVNLFWQQATDAQSLSSALVYDIFWTTNASLAFTVGERVATTSAGATTYMVTSLPRGLTYIFGVRARDPQNNTDSNMVTRSVYLAAANPPVNGGIPYLVGNEMRGATVTSYSLNTPVSLGNVAPSGTTAELTGPRFMADGTLVGIGSTGGSGNQYLYRRAVDGSFSTVRTISGVNSGTAGTSTPGSSTAFGLTGFGNNNQIIYTLDGASADLVNVHAYDVATLTDRFLLSDVRRVAPVPDGKIVYVYYDNLYLMTVPTNLASGTPTVRPLTTSGGYDGALVFGRHNGTSAEVLSIDPTQNPLQVKVIDPANGNLTNTITLNAGATGLAGGFVLGTAAGLMRGDVVLQRYISAGEHHLVVLDLGGSMVRELTPMPGLGAAVLDTVN